MHAHRHQGGPAIPPDDPAQLAESLMHAARRLRRGGAAGLSPLGLTFAQARVMRLIAEPDSSMRMADLAAQLDVVPRSATSMVDSLETAGLVGRHADPHDRRSVLVTLTAEGRRLLDGLDAARQATAVAMFGSLSPADRRELARLLSGLGSCECTHSAARAGR